MFRSKEIITEINSQVNLKPLGHTLRASVANCSSTSVDGSSSSSNSTFKEQSDFAKISAQMLYGSNMIDQLFL